MNQPIFFVQTVYNSTFIKSLFTSICKLEYHELLFRLAASRMYLYFVMYTIRAHKINITLIIMYKKQHKLSQYTNTLLWHVIRANTKKFLSRDNIYNCYNYYIIFCLVFFTFGHGAGVWGGIM